jgi:hypothetical protein
MRIPGQVGLPIVTTSPFLGTCAPRQGRGLRYSLRPFE